MSNQLGSNVQLSANGGSGKGFTSEVMNYASLPAPGAASGLYYWVRNPSVVSNVKYPMGAYRSNGSTWEYDAAYSQAAIWGTVPDYAALPLGTADTDPQINDLVAVNTTTGVWPVNKRLKGYYRRVAMSGVAATDYGTEPFAGFVQQATQAQVDAGTDTDSFVTALTFTNASKWNTKQDSFTAQPQNLFFASPNGASGIPTFRSIVSADINTFGFVNGGNSFAGTANLGTTNDFGLQFITNNAVRGLINTSGGFGIGVSSITTDSLHEIGGSITPSAASTIITGLRLSQNCITTSTASPNAAYSQLAILGNFTYSSGNNPFAVGIQVAPTFGAGFNGYIGIHIPANSRYIQFGSAAIRIEASNSNGIFITGTSNRALIELANYGSTVAFQCLSNVNTYRSLVIYAASTTVGNQAGFRMSLAPPGIGDNSVCIELASRLSVSNWGNSFNDFVINSVSNNTRAEVARFTGQNKSLLIGQTSTDTAFLNLAASTSARASMRLVAGVDVSSPNDGEIWYIDTNDRLMFRRNSVTAEVLSAAAVTTETLASNTSLTIVYNGVTYKLLARA